MGWNPLWAWVCCVFDPQDSIKELMNCVLRHIGQENGGPMWAAACQISSDQGLPLLAKEKGEYTGKRHTQGS